MNGFEQKEIFIRIIPISALAAAPYATKSWLKGRIRASKKGNKRVYYLSRILDTYSGQPRRLVVTSAVSDALDVEYEPPTGTDGLHTLTIPDAMPRSFAFSGLRYNLVLSEPSSRM